MTGTYPQGGTGPSSGPSARVLSIQSHVVSGYVGNKAACLPLQVLGIDVDIVNSCMLSNHTGYVEGAHGPKTSPAELAEIIDGLKRNNLLGRVTHVLTGYAGRADFLDSIEQTIALVNNCRPSGASKVTYVCDPVLGDNGRLYVSPDLVPVYRKRILPLASMLTPNAFELALLAEVEPIAGEKDLHAACQLLHDKYNIPTISVTGVAFQDRPGVISTFVSTASGEFFAVDAKRLDATFTGSGDLTAALILAWTNAYPNDLRAAYHRAIASVTAVLERTHNESTTSDKCRMPELLLVQSIADVQNPPLYLAQLREIPPYAL